MIVSTMIQISTNHNNNTITKITNIVLTSLLGTADASNIVAGSDPPPRIVYDTRPLRCARDVSNLLLTSCLY